MIVMRVNTLGSDNTCIVPVIDSSAKRYVKVIDIPANKTVKIIPYLKVNNKPTYCVFPDNKTIWS